MHYVACLDLTGRRCLVVGRSESKVRALEACGAEVVSVDRYEPELLDDVWLVVVVDVEQGERVSVSAVGSGAFAVTIAVDGLELSVRLDRAGARVHSVGV